MVRMYRSEHKLPVLRELLSPESLSRDRDSELTSEYLRLSGTDTSGLE